MGLGEGGSLVVDGTLIPTDRVAADEPYYYQEHKQHGMNVQVITRLDGPHDLTAARAHGIVQACLTLQTLALADRAYQGAGSTVHTPYYGHREPPDHYQRYNRAHARLRAPANAPSPS